jgi:hypothetical protein
MSLTSPKGLGIGALFCHFYGSKNEGGTIYVVAKIWGQVQHAMVNRVCCVFGCGPVGAAKVLFLLLDCEFFKI